MGINVLGIWCYTCGDFIYSRAQHDSHSCSCGDPEAGPMKAAENGVVVSNSTGCTVDGGFDYLRSSWGGSFRGETITQEIEVDIVDIPEGYDIDPFTSQEAIMRAVLWLDWNTRRDRYGRIKKGKRPNIPAGILINRNAKNNGSNEGSKT